MNLEKKTTFNRIAGFKKEDESSFLKMFARDFKRGHIFPFQHEKPEELTRLIGYINQETKGFLLDMGLPYIAFNPDKLIYLDFETAPKEFVDMLNKNGVNARRAYFMPETQDIVVLQSYSTGKKVPFLDSFIHELFHANSFNSLQRSHKAGHPAVSPVVTYKDGTKETMNLKLRRGGFRMYGRDGKTYFYNIDEAVIEILHIMLRNKIFPNIPELQEELNKTSKAIAENNAQSKDISSVVTKRDEDGVVWAEVHQFAYLKERQELNKLIDDLFNKNQAKFNSRDEVFQLFVLGTFSGNVMPIARLIEDTYGKGSFRRLGEQTQKGGKKIDLTVA